MNKIDSNPKPVRKKPGDSKNSQLKDRVKNTGNETENVKNEDGILVDTARKIETGAKVVSEKATDMAEKVSDQTTEIAEIVYDKFKKGVSDAYDVGSKTVGDISKKAVKYIKKYEDNIEMNKLKQKRNKKMQELGTHIFTLYHSKSQNLQQTLSTDESQKILNELEVLNKKIIKIGKQYKKKK